MDKVTLENKPYLRWLTLFISSGTLVCCALPIIMVTMGFGAIVASLQYNIPGLVFLGEQKIWALSLSAILLSLLAWMVWRPNQSCPTDPTLAEVCNKSRLWNRRIFSVSLGIWMFGFFFSVLLLPIRQYLNL